MADMSPKTFPIALALAGGAIITAALVAEHLDTITRNCAIFLGIVVILIAVGVYAWERSEWYDYAKSFPVPITQTYGA